MGGYSLLFVDLLRFVLCCYLLTLLNGAITQLRLVSHEKIVYYWSYSYIIGFFVPFCCCCCRMLRIGIDDDTSRSPVEIHRVLRTESQNADDLFVVPNE